MIKCPIEAGQLFASLAIVVVHERRMAIEGSVDGYYPERHSSRPDGHASYVRLVFNHC